MKKKTDNQCIEDICVLFADISIEIWERIKFSREQNLPVHEPTITQNLIFRFWQEAKNKDLPIQLYEANNEKSNGNDIELLLETDGGYILCACQAKISKKNEKYPTINHSVQGVQQVDLLINYASTFKGLPLYLFYNYSIEYDYNPNIELYGCTIGNAHSIKDMFFTERKRNGDIGWRIPSFTKLHYEYFIAEPISEVIFRLLHGGFLTLPSLAIAHRKNDIKFYTREEIDENTFWHNLFPLGQIGFITESNIQTLIQQAVKSEDGFNPKYRIVISKRKKGGAIYRVS